MFVVFVSIGGWGGVGFDEGNRCPPEGRSEGGSERESEGGQRGRRGAGEGVRVVYQCGLGAMEDQRWSGLM